MNKRPTSKSKRGFSSCKTQEYHVSIKINITVGPTASILKGKQKEPGHKLYLFLVYRPNTSTWLGPESEVSLVLREAVAALVGVLSVSYNERGCASGDAAEAPRRDRDQHNSEFPLSVAEAQERLEREQVMGNERNILLRTMLEELFGYVSELSFEEGEELKKVALPLLRRCGGWA